MPKPDAFMRNLRLTAFWGLPDLAVLRGDVSRCVLLTGRGGVVVVFAGRRAVWNMLQLAVRMVCGRVLFFEWGHHWGGVG